MMRNTTCRLVPAAFGDAVSQRVQLWLPHGQKVPLVVLIHGGFWREGKTYEATAPLAAALAAAGLAVWNIEYRAGAGHGWRTTLNDVATAIDHIATLPARYPVDITRHVLVGHSAGGQLALWAAARRTPQHQVPAAVVSLAGICDLVYAAEAHLGEDAVVDFLGGGPYEQFGRYQAACPTLLTPLGVRQVVVHGGADTRVPMEVSRRYARTAGSAGDDVELVELPGADHRALIDPDSDAGRDVVSLIGRVVNDVRHGGDDPMPNK
jgi:acetyl esterase/lipase